MRYRVINKDGGVAHISYICFGALSMVDAWNFEFQNNLTYTFPDGEEVAGWDIGDELTEKINDCTYVKGFYPANFAALQYLPPMERSGVEFFINHPEVLDHPLFVNVTMTMDDNQVYFNTPMGDLGMDETLYPMLFIRNVCEYTFSTNSLEKALEDGASPLVALFIANLIGVSQGIPGMARYYTMEGGDSCVMYSLSAPFGNFIQLIKGDLPFIYYDRKWTETNQGYSTYGNYAQKYVSWEDAMVDEDDWDEEDEWEEKEEDPADRLPIHPVTNNPATLVCASAFEKPEVYTGELRSTLLSIRPVNDAEFPEFVKKVMAHV